MQIDDLQREMSHQAGDRVPQLEESLALWDEGIQELERTTAGALEHTSRLEGELEESRRLAEERLRALEERDAEVASLTVQQ